VTSSLLLYCAACIAKVPGAWQRCPTPSAAWILGGILLLFVWSFFNWRRFWIPGAYVVVLLACLSLGSELGSRILRNGCWPDLLCGEEKIWQKNASVLSLTFLDVGEGDSILIRFPNQRLWLVDAGGLLQAAFREDGAYAFDLGEAVVSRYLWYSWINRLDRLILSHTDLDHAGGAPAILRNFRVGSLDYSQAASDEILAEILDTARERRVKTSQVYAGMQEKIGQVSVRAVHPFADSAIGSANEDSLVLHFSYKSFSALLTGDLEKAGEAAVLSRQGDMHSLLLKVAHHGSRWATSDVFLERTQPRWGIVSVGHNNPYSHPSPDVLLRLKRHGARPFLTPDEGAITFETDGGFYVIRSYISGVLEKGSL
jgi:competence protein ComEC